MELVSYDMESVSWLVGRLLYGSILVFKKKRSGEICILVLWIVAPCNLVDG
jgi:hypothetical protein